MRSQGRFSNIRRAAVLAAVAGVSLAMALPANAQFPWFGGGQQQRPARQPQQQQQPQQGYNPFGGWFGTTPAPQQQQAPADYSRAPTTPRKADTPAPTTSVLVLGDAMADWLAYGLEDAFAEKPEMGVIRKHRTTSGLIRYELRRDTEWAQVAREAIAADKPKFIVMMIGVHDRQAIRERTAATQPARGAARTATQQPATRPPVELDPESRAQQSADQQNAEMQEAADRQAAEQQQAAAAAAAVQQQATPSATGPFEFHTEQWEAAYIKRIDATMAALKTAGVPVFWVGLPSQRNTRASTDSVYLNELYRTRAERAGIIFVDVWDGFVDDAGRFTAQGPDFEGQIRRLRAGDGVYFTKAGARKLAHYVEREIIRSMTSRALPVALPAIEQVPTTPGVRPGTAQRPLVGPVVPLTAASGGGGNELLGGGVARPVISDPVAIRVLTKGEPIAAPGGRADDFSWPRALAPVVTAVPAPTTTPPRTNTAGQPKSGPAAGQGTSTDTQRPPARRRPAGAELQRPPGSSASVPQGTVR